MQEYLKQELERLAARPSLHERVWSLRKNVTSHDAWYMAVAEAFDAPLSTLDRALERSTGPTCRFRMPG